MKNISISIPGGNGRMGKTLLSLIIENEKFNYTVIPEQKIKIINLINNLSNS